MNRWHDDMQAMPQRLMLKYEQMRAEPVEALDRVMTSLDHGFERHVTEASVEFASFDSLFRKEVDGCLKSKQTETEQSRRRRLIQGATRQDRWLPGLFHWRQNAHIDRLVSDRLNPLYGYR